MLLGSCKSENVLLGFRAALLELKTELLLGVPQFWTEWGTFLLQNNLDDAPFQGPYSANKRDVMSYSSSSWFHYRCKDCGCEVGFRSHPRSLGERYLLPIF